MLAERKKFLVLRDMLQEIKFGPGGVAVRRCKPRVPVLQTKAMGTSIRIYASPKEMKAEEYHYWQSRLVRDEAAADVRRLRGPVVCLQRPQRKYLIMGSTKAGGDHVGLSASDAS
jgi:hypothetical protein